MLAWDGDELPQEVLDLARRMARWKRGRIGRARMLEDLSVGALDLTCEWGPYRAAQVLGLSFVSGAPRPFLTLRRARGQIQRSEPSGCGEKFSFHSRGVRRWTSRAG